MLYIFYGLSYKINYQRAFNFAKNITKNPIVINESVINYNKEDISLFLYYFSLPASENDPSVIIIENPENIKEILIQCFLSIFENIPPFHVIILVTNQLHKIQKTIISRALLILDENNNKNELESKWYSFLHMLETELLTTITIEDLIDSYDINEKDTIDISVILFQKYKNKTEIFNTILKQYLPFIKNSHYLYWKMIYLILHTKK